MLNPARPDFRVEPRFNALKPIIQIGYYYKKQWQYCQLLPSNLFFEFYYVLHHFFYYHTGSHAEKSNFTMFCIFNVGIFVKKSVDF